MSGSTFGTGLKWLGISQGQMHVPEKILQCKAYSIAYAENIFPCNAVQIDVQSKQPMSLN